MATARRPKPLKRIPLPDILATAARAMAPAYLRRRLARAGTPYASGRTTTFVYVGEAESVRIVHFMMMFPEIPPLTRLEDTDLWHVTVELPERSRLEYKIEVVGEDRTDRILDPLNRRTASDPFGSNSVAHGPGYIDPAWATPAADAAIGDLEIIDIGLTAFGDERTLTVYTPDGFPDGGPYPVALFHDGSDLIEYASVTTVLDNLIGAGSVPPIVAVLMDPVDRNREYAASADHARFVLDDVLPHVTTEFNVTSDPRRRILGGASLGAVATLAAAVSAPGPVREPRALVGVVRHLARWPVAPRGRVLRGGRVHDVVPGRPVRPARSAWMACGAFESLATDNRAFLPTLRSTGMAVHYEETPDGHHWANWRNNIGTALRALIPLDTP